MEHTPLRCNFLTDSLLKIQLLSVQKFFGENRARLRPCMKPIYFKACCNRSIFARPEKGKICYKNV
jgi:hypothetical protein